MTDILATVEILNDATAAVEKRLEAAQQASDLLQTISDTSLDDTLSAFLNILQTTQPTYVSEYPTQKLRKLVIDMIHRLTSMFHIKEKMRAQVNTIIRVMLNLFETDNEEIVAVVLRIIIELQKSFKPEFISEIHAFLDNVKNLYKDINNIWNFETMFEEKRIIVSELTDQKVEELLGTLHTTTTVEVSSASQEDSPQSYTIIPKSNHSLRVIAELPIIVVLLYQMHRTQLQQPLEQLLPYVLETTVLRPPEHIRNALKTGNKLDKDIYVEFIGAQIKCLSFVAFLARLYISTIAKHHQQLTQGLLALLHDCPHEVVSIRKELIAATKYIFGSELRDKFMEHLHIICNDEILVGSGWTVHETLRPQAYHLIIDLLSNYKGRIKHKDAASAMNLFAKNLHDDTLPHHVQLLSCKAFSSLVGFIIAPLGDEKVEPRDIIAVRDLLMRIIEVFVLKFKNIANSHLPQIMKRIKAQQAQSQSNQENITINTNPSTPQKADVVKSQITVTSDPAHRDDKPKPDMSTVGTHGYNILECRSAIKSLIIGIRATISAIPSYRLQGTDQMLMPADAKLFHPKETIVLVRLLKYGLKTLDVFSVTPTHVNINPQVGQMNRQMLAQATRSKEEKELMENFASVFTSLHPLIFREVFSKMISFVVERTRQNVALFTIANFIISAPSVSPIFSTILSEYLIERMENIGSNSDLSALYLRMFKMIFASVTLYPVENEQMLKPLLRSIVNKSVELALSAQEPYNYFLLLRALFRSIGGGSHDQLYQEFLPLLPNLLQGLNSFQSGHHKPHMKDLITELCLTVPVRLSSLMPFMPTLIYPLVSALNGPTQLVSQGLRTLELCVDNLTPDYLYDLLQPVRAELMQGLWKTLRHPNEPIALNCLRVLGKFGGNNRRMLIEPQRLNYIEQRNGISANTHTSIVVHFTDQKVSINLPIDRAVVIACETLKQQNSNPFYKAHSWDVIKGVLIANMGLSVEQTTKIKDFFSNPNLASAHMPIRRGSPYVYPDQLIRGTYKTALIGAMLANSNRDLRPSVTPFLNAIVRHHVMLSIGQHLSIQSSDNAASQYQSMDALVLVDALAVVVGHDEKELCKSGYYVTVLMVETATMLLGSRERASELPLISYLVKSLYELCYTRAWFSKMGGCVSIRYFTDNMPLSWLFKNLTKFIRALLYVMSDLTGELSSGTLDIAQSNLERLITVCAQPINSSGPEESALAQAQSKAITETTELLIKEITSQNLNARTQSMKSIEAIAKMSNKSVAQIMEPHRHILKTMLPFLSSQQEGERQPIHALEKQPVRNQIGVIHGSTFCTNLEPNVFTIDTSIREHTYYVEQLVSICENDDTNLKKLQCYANVSNLAPVRTAALHALASLHYLKEYELKIFKILFKSTESTNPELQQGAHACINKFCSKVKIDTAVIQEETAPLFERLKDSSQWNMHALKRLMCIAKLFPTIFHDTFCVELQEHLANISKSAINDLKSPLNPNEKVYERTSSANEKIQVCAGIIELLALVPTVVASMISKLVSSIFKFESTIVMETGSPLREPLKKFLRRFPDHTISLLMTERNLHEQQVYRLLKYLLKGDDGKIFRNVINQQNYYIKLVQFTSGVVHFPLTETDESGQVHKRQIAFDLRFQAILIISIMIKYENDWLLNRRQLVDNLQRIWSSDEFNNKHQNIDTTDYTFWKEPELLVQCLLNYFQVQTAAGNKDVIELLFQLLRVYTNRYLCNFDFFKLFLERTVIETYSIEWKRDAFAKFVSVFHDANYPQQLKARILQHIIIPSFSHSFNKGLGEALLGGPPQPDGENPNNLIHMFINKVIDPICSNDKKFVDSDAVRILLLQFSCLLVEKAAPHIHEAANRKQSSRLKKLVSLAWPCLMNRSSVDPAAKYHGHFLLAHIIAKFAVHKRIIMQVFHSLLKAPSPDARNVVKQALDVLLPAIPNRLDEGNSTLLKWTKKIIIDEGHILNQLIHMLQLIVRHYRLYYPLRTHMIPLMITSINKLAYTSGTNLENKKTAVDLCEVIIRWEMMRQKDEKEGATDALEPKHVDAILNNLLRLACLVNPGLCDLTPSPTYLTCKNLSDRCISLIRKILMPESWAGNSIVPPGGPDLDFANWMGEIFSSVQTQNCNIGSVSTALELLTYLCSIIKRDTMLVSLKSLTPGIIFCTKSQNSRIIRSVSNLVQRVMNVFPVTVSDIQPKSGTRIAAPHKDLEPLYSEIQNVIMSGLNMYEQTQLRQPETQPVTMRDRDNWQVPLFSSLMLLKAACINNPNYIDLAVPTLIRVIYKMTREHTGNMAEKTLMSVELLILGLDLVKNRLGAMGDALRKQFIQQILSNLIESPSSDVKVMKAVVRIVEEWVKQKQTLSTQGPNIREKTLLLIKLMLFIEKRFPTEPELNSQFLELIYYVYSDDELKSSDLTTKLENAFMAGLRCVQPHIRSKFFQIYNQNIKPKLYERLIYIVCAQNWQQIGCHFWIQQCIELVLAVALPDQPISASDASGCLPPIPTSADLGSYDPTEFENSSSSLLSMLSSDTNTVVPPPGDIEFVPTHDCIDNLTGFVKKPIVLTVMSGRKNLQIMVNRQVNFLEDLKRTRTGDMLRSLTQLCHMSVDLAKSCWIDMFPQIWKVLNDQQTTLLGREIVPFLCSGAHVFQRDCNPSAVGCFMEAVSRCQPPIQMRPILIKYLGKNHNLWHRAALMLEESCSEKSFDTIYPIPARSNKANQQTPQDFDIITLNPKITLREEATESISNILELLREDDLWAGLWQSRAKYEETKKAILCEQQGIYDQAQEYYELAMDKQRTEYNNTFILKPGMKSENRIWEKHWIRCTKELNQWDSLLEYGSSKACLNPMLVLESAWRVPNWSVMKEALMLVEENCPASLMWRLNLYKGYNYICNQLDPNALQLVDEAYLYASSYCIQTWKKLPHIVTNAHIPLLQAAQQLLELNEAKSLHLSLYSVQRASPHELRTIMKAWPKRLPILLDDLSYWSDILTWRQHQYRTIVAHFESQAINQQGLAPMMQTPPLYMSEGPASVAMQGAHFSAQGIISFGTVARKQGLVTVCLDAINRIHTIPSVPVYDCYQKIRQQVKCYMQMPLSDDKSELLDGIDIIDCTNLKFFQKEYVSEFHTYKGIFLARLGRHDDANKAFSAAAQLSDQAPKVWSSWGNYLESRFTDDFNKSQNEFAIDPEQFKNRQMDLGVSAITCFLQACKFYNESKARKYLAKVLWLLSFDNARGELVEVINKYSGISRDAYIPASNWVVWIPQILQCLMLNPEAEALRNLLITIGKQSPQAVYFPVRTLLLTLKIVFSGHTQKMRSSIHAKTVQRCSEIVKKLHEAHPTTISSLEGITDQMVWLRDYSYEEVQRQIQQALRKCYVSAFENSANILEQTVSVQTLNFIKKLVNTFGVSPSSNAQGPSQARCGLSSTTIDYLAMRNYNISQDPEFQQTRDKFRADFEDSIVQNMKLTALITKLKNWITILDEKKKLMPKTYMMEDKCRFLSNFSQHTADVEIPGDALMPKSTIYYVRIARFIPEVKVVDKHNISARRIFIRGHNGKVYPYLVLNDSCLSDSRREERVLQMLRLLNQYLTNKKETGRRYLQFTVPRVVAISPGLRLVEDNPSSLSLLSILKRRINTGKHLNSSLDPDSPISEYYDRLMKIQSQGSAATHKNLKDILTEVQAKMVPKTLVKEWASQTYENATDYWVFRSQLTYQLALACFSEFCFHLTRLMPENLYIHQDSGQINVSFFKFDLEDCNGELKGQRPVPFRLTPNLTELITDMGIQGPLRGALDAMAHCLTDPQDRVISIFRAILRDEMLFWQKRGRESIESEMLVMMVNRAVHKIYQRMEMMSTREKPLDSQAPELIEQAMSPEQLCKMDPAWHPWL